MGLSRSDFKKFGVVLKSRRAGLAVLAVFFVAVSYKVLTGSAPFFGVGAGGNVFPELGAARFPHYSPLTLPLLKSISPLSLLALVLLGLTFRLVKVIGSARKQIALEVTDQQSGSSSVEFVMVLPLLTIMLLMILQIALIVQAKFVVNYAAFCAARSAIVIIPDDVAGEGRNQMAPPNQSEKVDIIHRAASLPLSAISPLPGLSAARGVPILGNPNAVVELLKLAPWDVAPRSMMGQVMLRAPYSYHEENTAIKVLTQAGAQSGSYQEHDWVTVKVQYRYYLAVPFAKKLFGTAYSGNPFWNIIFGTDYFYPMVEQYTLPMDGEPSGL